MNKDIFKAYDIRGIYSDEIDEVDVYKITKAYCQFVKPQTVVVGSDIRLSSPSLKRTAIKAVTDLGIKVIDIGEISTDMLYFAVANYGYDGGFSITASHNPKEYNGMKMVREDSKPISADTGIFEIRDLAMQMEIGEEVLQGEINESLVEQKNILEDYAQKVKSFADFSKFKKSARNASFFSQTGRNEKKSESGEESTNSQKHNEAGGFKIVANPNFGVAGRALNKILEGTEIEIVKLNFEPNGNFPKGRPDPLIPENREEISKLVISEKADFGVAWDADADRCFFFTEKGEFIEGYFITALLAKIFLERNAGASILHDSRLVWAIEDIVKEYGGKDVQSKAGHAFIKERMRKEDSIFGGEMSAHYYFKDYFYCDNGMIPLVMMLEFLSTQTKTLSEIMNEIFWQKYFVSGEINTQVENVSKTLQKIKEKYADGKISEIDGVSVEFLEWRFNLRGSNTEPVIRLNVEAKNKNLLEEKTQELLKLVKSS